MSEIDSFLIIVGNGHQGVINDNLSSKIQRFGVLKKNGAGYSKLSFANKVNLYFKTRSKNFDSNKVCLNNDNVFIFYTGNISLVGGRNIDQTLKNLKNPNDLFNLAKEFQGSFSLICYFYNQDKLTCLRDKSGSKPLFISFSDSFRVCSSDPILAAMSTNNFDIDYEKLGEYVAIRYGEFWGREKTFIRNISFCKPAAMYTVDERSTKKEYLNFQDLQALNKSKTYDEYLAEGRDILLSEMSHLLEHQEITQRKPVLALSSGLDSSAVAVASKIIGKPIDTVTAYYTDISSVTEHEQAKVIADKLGSNWQKIGIEALDFLECWKTAYNFYQFPLSTSSYIGYDLLTKNIKSMGYDSIFLGGSGDDIFAGNYPCFLHFLADLYKSDDENFKHELDCWIKNHSTSEFPKDFEVFSQFFDDEVDKNVQGAITPKVKFLDQSLTSPDLVSAINKNFEPINILTHSYLKSLEIYGYWYGFRQPGLIPFFELASALDVMFLDPFSSEDFFNYGWQLPSSYKIKNGINKVLLRDIVGDHLPSITRKRVSKVGFNVPFEVWVTNKAFKEFLIDVINDSQNSVLVDFFDVKKLKSVIESNDIEKLNPMFIWQFVNAQLWLHDLENWGSK